MSNKDTLRALAETLAEKYMLGELTYSEYVKECAKVGCGQLVRR